MNILIHCQHVYGIGHLMRTFSIAQSIAQEHNVIMMCGGKEIREISQIGNFKMVWLDPICSNQDFTKYFSPISLRDYDDIYMARLNHIKDIIHKFEPDILWIEAFPFARRVFKKELVPSIRYVKERFPDCKILSSVRDILLSYNYKDDHRTKVDKYLNKYFDYVLVHSDPKLIPFDKTFGDITNLKPKFFYTGYICREMNIQHKPRMQDEIVDIVVSFGGSDFGDRLVEIVIAVHSKYMQNKKVHIFTGVSDKKYCSDNANITFHSFTLDYVYYLKKAALSISMCGYNTAIEAVATKTPSIFIPFNTNDEQFIRANLLREHHCCEVINFKMLNDLLLYNSIKKLELRSGTYYSEPSIDINGTVFINNFLKHLSCA